MEKDIFLTRKEIMEYLKIKRTALQRLMNRREFPFFKMDPGRRGRVLFKKSDIDKWFESKRVK